jgi:hypothetical protein
MFLTHSPPKAHQLGLIIVKILPHVACMQEPEPHIQTKFLHPDRLSSSLSSFKYKCIKVLISKQVLRNSRKESHVHYFPDT